MSYFIEKVKMSTVYENRFIRVEIEESEVPWLKVFTQERYKEFSHTPHEVKMEIFRVLEIIEVEMLAFFTPKKINIASFGNYVPHVHWHIMARFEEDSYFPEPMWGQRQREGAYRLENFPLFIQKLVPKLKAT